MKRTNAPARALWAGIVLSTAAMGAGSALAAPAPGPSFDQVLAAPDDVQLNIDYAQAQAKAGDLLEASAALERILLAHPNQADARLLYAVTLYRLDDLQNASEQLAMVDVAGLSPLQRVEADKYRRLIDARGATPGQRKARFGGEISVGISHDSDAFGALVTQFDVFGPATRKAGDAWTVSGDLHGAAPVGKDLWLTGSVAGYDRQRLSGADEGLKAGDARVGLSREGRAGGWAVNAVARTFTVFDRHDLDEYGLNLAASWRRNTATTIGFSAEAVHQDFHEPIVDALVTGGFINGTRDGSRYDINLGVTHRYGARSTVAAWVGWEYKTADYKPLGYSAPHVQGRWEVKFDRGGYFSANAGLHFVDYHGVDPVFAGGTRRRDVLGDARLALGAPISAFSAAGATGDFRENLVIEGALTYGRRDSRSPVIDYDDWGAQVNLIWRFGGRNPGIGQ